MKTNTSRFGEINVHENDFIFMPGGLVGFSKLNRFAFINESKSNFKWLQSLDDPEFALVIMEPNSIEKYTVEINQEDAAILKLTDTKNAVVFVIVTIPSDPQNMSVNLQAPLILNLKDKIAKQIILHDDEIYPTKHFIFNKH